MAKPAVVEEVVSRSRKEREDLPQNFIMSVDEWLNVPSNPRQRDTEKHLQRARHLLVPSPTHRRVAMASTRDGRRHWKLDGHTRALGWQRGMIPRPENLNVAVFYVDSQLEAEELYTTFDAGEAVETGSDKVYGAYQALGWKPQSKYLMMMGVNTAVRVAQGLAEGARRASKDSIYRLVGDWLQELKRADTFNPDHKRFSAALLTACIVSFRKYPDDQKVYDFWVRYNEDSGEKIGEAMDPVEGLTRFMLAARGEMGARRTIDASRYSVIGRALGALEGFRRDLTYTRTIPYIDPTKFLTER